MDVSSAEFTCSYPSVRHCPEGAMPEFAFIGRSNVGKSSLINMLTGRTGLAKVSATPGKTRLINYFLINRLWYLVDLPGYGFARVGKKEQEVLARMIDGYLLEREQMALAFILIDSSIPPTKIDLAFVNKMGEHGVPFALIFTKADKLNKTALEKNIGAFMDALRENWETLPTYFVSSSMHRGGRQELLEFIGKTAKKLS